MALSTILLLSLLLLIVPSYRILDPTFITLAISQATGNVCCITAGSKHHSVQCTTVQESGGHNRSFATDPTLSIQSISGAHNFNCSLISGDASCWVGMNQQDKCIYSGPTEFTELSAGVQHVATIAGDPRKMQTIQGWRLINDVLQSLMSGDIFTCAIDGTRKAHCWEPHVQFIPMRFEGANKRNVSSGGSPMCGLNMSGHLYSGEQLILPAGEAFEFTNLAIRLSYYCAIWQKHRTVICCLHYCFAIWQKHRTVICWVHYCCAIWQKHRTVICWVHYCCAIWQKHRTVICQVQDGSYFPVTRGDLTCGLNTEALNMVCSGLNERNMSAVALPLPQISHNVCIQDETFCSRGVQLHSGNLCGESGITCNGLDTRTMESFELLAAPSSTTWERQGKWWFMFAIFGAVFFIAVVRFLFYFM